MTLAAIKTDIETFFKNTGTRLESFGAAFLKLFGKAPSILQSVDNFINMAAPVITAAVALADPIAEPAAAAVLATIETGLAAVSASATAAVSGTSLLANLQSFAATVPALLTGVAVKNPALQTKIEGIVSLVTGEAKVLIPAVQAAVAQVA